MNYKKIRKIWNRYTEGWFGNIVYIFLGLIIAYSINLGLSVALNTETPVVSVVSESMEHIPDKGILCGKNTEKYGNNYTYWMVCGPWYELKGISKAEFDKFPFPEGFNKGDILFVVNTNDLNVGDVIVFNVHGIKYPIIHRIISIDGKNIQTKGDHNPVSDNWKIKNEDIYGKAVFIVPYVGWIKIGLMEFFGLI